MNSLEKAFELEEISIFNPALLGLGSCGCNEASRVRTMLDEVKAAKDIPLGVANTSKPEVKTTFLNLKKAGVQNIAPLVIGDGMGAGMDANKGEKLINSTWDNTVHKYVEIITNEQSVDTLFIFAGLGHGTGSNIAYATARIQDEFPDLIVCPVVYIPRRANPNACKIAAESLEKIWALNVAPIVIDNQNAVDHYMNVLGTKSHTEALRALDKDVALSFATIIKIMTSNPVYSFDKADFKACISRTEFSILGMTEYPLSVQKINEDLLEQIHAFTHVDKRWKADWAIIGIDTKEGGQLYDTGLDVINSNMGDTGNVKAALLERDDVDKTRVVSLSSGYKMNSLRPKLVA